MLSGRMGERMVMTSDVKEAMGQLNAGKITEQEFYAIESNACPSAGACNFMGTANTMTCVTETLGMSLPGCATLPALHPMRRELCVNSGKRIMDLVRLGFTSSAMLTRESLQNAIRVVLALGGSTNAVLHLLAIAHAAGVALDLGTFDELSRQTPLIGKFKPTSPFTVVDLDNAGGIPAVLNILSPLLHLDLPTVSGETIRERAARGNPSRPDILHPLDSPWIPRAGLRSCAVTWLQVGLW